MTANETMEGKDTIRLTLTTEEVYYAPAVTTKEIQLTNADSADGWWVYEGDTFSIDTGIKSEGTGSIKYAHTGGVAWGATFDAKDITGIKSISFDIASDNAGILTEPTDKCFLLMSDGVLPGFHEPFNGEAFLNNADVMKKVMQFDVSVFNTNKDEYTLTPDSQTFKTVTLTPSVVGEEFNYKNVTNFMHWSCSGYGGDHTEWIDNIVVNVIIDEPVDTEVVVNNCDSADGWACYPGDGLELDTDKKTEGTGSIHTIQSGGFVQGGPIANLDLTGIQSISFDFAANTAEALSGPEDVAFYLFSGADFVGYQELNEVDTSKVMAFDVDAIRAGYGKDDQSFANITTTPVSIGENFDITNVTGFMFWGCTAYDGSHEQWIDNIVAKVINEPVDADVDAVIEVINALPEAGEVIASDRYAIFAAQDAYDALSEDQKAKVTNADKLTAAVDAVNALKVTNEILLDDGLTPSRWSVGGCGASIDTRDVHGDGKAYTFMWWHFRTCGIFASPMNITGAQQVKIDLTGDNFDADAPETLATVLNKDIVNAKGDLGIALTSYTGSLPTGVVSNEECGDNTGNNFILTGEAWTDYAVRLTADNDVISGMNTFNIDYTTAGSKFDASKVTAIALVGTNGHCEEAISGVWAVKESWPVDPAAQAVIDAIDALPEAGDVTFDDAAAIDAALAAYNELNENVKGEVTNADKLIQVKAAIDELFANADIIGVKTDWIYTSFYGDGFEFDAEAEKTYTVKAKISATAGETDERYIAKLQMISDRDTQSSAKIMFSDYEALPEETDAKYGYTYKTLSAELTAAETAKYKAVFVYGGKNGDLHNASVITYAVEVYDGETLISSFCPADEGVAIVEDEEGHYWTYVYGTPDAVYTLIETIDALPEVDDLTAEDVAAVRAAKAAYDKLSEEQQGAVTNAQKLLDLVEKANAEFGDRYVVENFIEAIRALPEEDDVTADDLEAINAVYDIVRTLNADQIKIIRDEYPNDIKKLYAVKKRVDKLTYVDAKVLCTCERDTEDVFDFCGNEHATKDGALWMKVVAGSETYPDKPGFNAVYIRVGRYFGEEDYTHTFNYNDYYQFEVLVNPDQDNVWNITHGNEENVLEWQYPSEITLAGNKWQRASVLMSDIGKTTVQPSTPKFDLSNVNLLHILQRNAGEFTLKNIAIVTEGYAAARAAAEQAFLEAVAAIGEVTVDSGDAIATAKAAREEVFKWINVETDENMAASAVLDQAIFDYAMLDEANADVKAAYDKIVALSDTVTIDDQAAVADAKAAFDGLTDEKKAIIPADMVAKLEKAVDDIATIVVVNPVIDAIEALADPDTVSYENLETVKAAAATVREALDALNDTQKDKVVNASKLEAVEAKIAELEGDKQTADAVATAINALPSLEEMTADKVADVTVAGIQFDALTDAQKALISEELKNKLAALREWAPVADVVYGDLNGDGNVTVDDALLALQGAVGKIELTDAQIEAADVDGEAGVGVSDALAILQKAVGKVETLPLVVE